MHLVTSFCLSLVVLVTSQDNVDYSKHRLVRVRPSSANQHQSLVQYLTRRQQQGDIDIWQLSRNVKHGATFSLSNHMLKEVSHWLEQQEIDYHVEQRDLKRLADDATRREANIQRKRSQTGNTRIDLDVYNTYKTISDYLKDTAEECDICELITIGQSYEGLDMYVIKIGDFEENKKAIFIDAGIHAREWISPATALKLINYLVEGYSEEDPDASWVLDNFVFFILPSANPDGYSYSWDENRYWRKTRRPQPASKDCVGADPNRNWNIDFGGASTSSDPCDYTYPGERPWSEVEVRNMRNFLLRRRRYIDVYISLHAYGQMWMYPWGYTDSLPSDWEELDRVGQAVVDAIKDSDEQTYDLGSIAQTIYPVGGNSVDWVKAKANITYAYAVELRDEGDYGFLLPSRYISPTSREIWAGIVAMARAIKENQK